MSHATNIIDRSISPRDNAKVMRETGYDLKELLKKTAKKQPSILEGLTLNKEAFKTFMAAPPEQKKAEIRSFIIMESEYE